MDQVTTERDAHVQNVDEGPGRRWRVWNALVAGIVAASACGEEPPTAVDASALPSPPVTVELRLPWSEYASSLEVFGGYGAPAELGSGVVAQDFGGTLDARTLVRYGGYPVAVSVRDTTGTTRPDSSLTFIGGRLVAFLDTLASRADGPVTLALGAIQQEWDVRTVSWTVAVDTINDRRLWAEPGAGPVVPLATAVWDPAEGDSVWFELDSAMVAAWADTTDASRGARIDALTPGVRLQVNGTVLRLNTRPSLNPDSTFFLVASQREITFVYDPFPEPPPDGIRVGGAPAWRTVFDVTVPRTLNGPEELCEAVGCPLELDPNELSFAGLILYSRRTPEAFQPTDTVGVDVRPVLLRDALPKAPLGNTLVGAFGRRIAPEAFGDGEGTQVELPITPFARDLLRGETPQGTPPPSTLALLSVFEPISISFASFHGPGSAFEPVLRLVVTVARPVELP